MRSGRVLALHHYLLEKWITVTYRQQQTDDTQREQTSAHLGDSAVVDLFTEAEAAEEERHAENEQQVGQDGPEKGRLDDTDLILGEGNAV